MLAETLIRTPRAEGLHSIQPRGAHGARQLAGSRLCLSPGHSVTFQSASEESIVILQEGAGTFAAGGHAWTVSRRNVFDERATALLLPPGTTFTATASSPLEAILVSALATPAASAADGPALVTPGDVEVLARGRGQYSRSVHNIFVTDPHARRLMVGETFNQGGNWSSFPPHKHDGRDGEPNLEEVYYFRIRPAHGFGLQVLYTADGESMTHQVRDGDVVVLPYGYHPVAAVPGYDLCYLWAMVGDERKLALFEDPAHTWIHSQAGA